MGLGTSITTGCASWRIVGGMVLSIGFDECSSPVNWVEPKTIVECKSHRWTSGRNVPSAKLTVWNEAMLYFIAAPCEYRKIMFVLRDYCSKREETLAGYYVRTYSHLIPAEVEFWEYDESTSKAVRLSI